MGLYTIEDLREIANQYGIKLFDGFALEVTPTVYLKAKDDDFAPTFFQMIKELGGGVCFATVRHFDKDFKSLLFESVDDIPRYDSTGHFALKTAAVELNREIDSVPEDTVANIVLIYIADNGTIFTMSRIADWLDRILDMRVDLDFSLEEYEEHHVGFVNSLV